MIPSSTLKNFQEHYHDSTLGLEQANFILYAGETNQFLLPTVWEQKAGLKKSASQTKTYIDQITPF